MSIARTAALVGALGALALPATAPADTEKFHRFEVIATADWRNLTETCSDGSTAPLRVFVEGGYEEESENGVVTDPGTHRIRFGITSRCGGTITNSGALSNNATLTWSPSLQTARLVGTATVPSTGAVLSADITWTGVGPLEVETNSVAFPGRVAHFVGRERDVTATGTVTRNGTPLMTNAFTANARLETLEDKIIEKPE